MSSREVDIKINAIVAPLSTQLEIIIQPVSELGERSSTRSTEGNVLSERSRSSGQLFDNVQEEYGNFASNCFVSQKNEKRTRKTSVFEKKCTTWNKSVEERGVFTILVRKLLWKSSLGTNWCSAKFDLSHESGESFQENV